MIRGSSFTPGERVLVVARTSPRAAARATCGSRATLVVAEECSSGSSLDIGK